MPKFTVSREIVVEADDVTHAAVVADAMIRTINDGRYDITDEAAYTFHVSVADVASAGAEGDRPP